MNSVLFVDDEPLMRELYASLPRELGKDFQVRTVASGEAALRAMEEHPADIVVSDLSMPEMHGGEFLTAVERNYPEAMRVVISGKADQLAVARCLMYGHRYFLKPLQLKELALHLNRISRLRTVVSNDRVKKIVGRSDVLPTPPETYLRLTELIEDSESSMEDVAAVVEADPALTAKLLQVVNSAAFGIGGGIATVSQAVQIAGVEVIGALLLGLQARGFAEKKLKNRQLLSVFWDHSLDTATRCRAIAQAEGFNTVQQATCFTVGMLHDIGKIVLAANEEKEYGALVAAAVREKIPIYKKELECYQATHADIGAYLLGLWGLPDEIITAVERHHSLGADLGKKFSSVLCVHVAQNLASIGSRVAELDEKFLKDCKLSGRIQAWEEALENEVVA
jgi:putative nucleotidyltransferase with HDIG domain